MKVASYVIAFVVANILAWRLGKARVFNKETAKENMISLISFAVGILVGVLAMF